MSRFLSSISRYYPSPLQLAYPVPPPPHPLHITDQIEIWKIRIRPNIRTSHRTPKVLNGSTILRRRASLYYTSAHIHTTTHLARSLQTQTIQKNSPFCLSQSFTENTPLFPCSFASLLHPVFCLSQLRSPADLKSVKVSPSTSNGRFASPELVIALAGTPPRAWVKLWRLDVCRRKSVWWGTRWM